MFGNAKFSHYRKQTLYSYLKIISGLLLVGLTTVSILGCYYLPNNNGIDALTESAQLNGQIGENDGSGYSSYYSSISSNLSRGLPIDEGVPTEPLNGQQEDVDDNFNPTDQGSQQEQEQVSQLSVSNTNPQVQVDEGIL